MCSLLPGGRKMKGVFITFDSGSRKKKVVIIIGLYLKNVPVTFTVLTRDP